MLTLTGSGMLLMLPHYIGFLSYAVDVLRYVALNVVNLRCLVVIHWSFQQDHGKPTFSIRTTLLYHCVGSLLFNIEFTDQSAVFRKEADEPVHRTRRSMYL